MKLLKKLIGFVTIFMSLTIATTSFIGCSHNSTSDSETDIEISLLQSGIGDSWLSSAINEFKKTNHEYNFIINPTIEEVDEFRNTITLSDNTTDIYFCSIDNSDIAEYGKYMEPLDDVLTYKHEGESKTIGEKISESVLAVTKDSSGNSLFLPSVGGELSFAYNTEILDNVNYMVPRTTDEMISLCSKLKTDNYTPFCSFKDGGYWRYIYEVWFAQYNGLDYYNNTFLPLGGSDLNKAKEFLVDNNKETGRYQTLKVIRELMADKYQQGDSYNGEFNLQQIKFVSNGDIAMMPNGTWLYNEVSSQAKENFTFKMMKVPVLSAIIDNLDSIEDDYELSALIDVIDSKDKVGDVPLTGANYSATSSDVQRVWEARNTIKSNIDSSAIIIPKKTKVKEGAKKFLKFLYSDEMLLNYNAITHLSFAAHPCDSQVDISDYNGWELSVYQIEKNANFLLECQKRSPILNIAGAFGGIKGINAVSVASSFNRSIGMTPIISLDDYWSDMQRAYNNNWNSILYRAGLD